MRVFTIVLLLGALAPALAAAQPSGCATPATGAVTFDPYKPSHLAIIRNYGGALLAQAPLPSLLQLDPYVPSEAALLRQVGGGIPVWLAWAPSGFAPPAMADDQGSCAAEELPEIEPAAASVMTTLGEVLARLEPGSTRAPVVSRRIDSQVSVGRNAISIEFDGRVWTSAGAAVVFDESTFELAGHRAGVPVYRQRRGDVAVIFIPTTAGMVAPFRAAPPPVRR